MGPTVPRLVRKQEGHSRLCVKLMTRHSGKERQGHPSFQCRDSSAGRRGIPGSSGSSGPRRARSDEMPRPFALPCLVASLPKILGFTAFPFAYRHTFHRLSMRLRLLKHSFSCLSVRLHCPKNGRSSGVSSPFFRLSPPKTRAKSPPTHPDSLPTIHTHTPTLTKNILSA